jgi:histidine triad (HIT) family protein
VKTEGCKFCGVVAGEVSAQVVLDEPALLAFLDVRPLFHGHCLLVPKTHCETLADVPAELLGPLLAAARRLAAAVEKSLGADGTFVAINNRVSQSVPHLHIHVVPRRHKDGLRGFFWPRQKYQSDETMISIRDAIRAALAGEAALSS